MASDTAYALATIDAGKLWYLHRDSNAGLLRTDVPLFARTWTSEIELKLWLDGLPDAVRKALAGRRLVVVPLTVSAGDGYTPGFLSAFLASCEALANQSESTPAKKPPTTTRKAS